jgi:lambda family phage tail tape measure protein
VPVNVGQIVISLGANTAQFSLEMTRAEQLAAAKGGQIQGTLAKLSGSAKAWGQATHDAGGHAVTGVQATSASLRVLEGNMTNNLRAAERFVANTLGMGNALKAAFPVVGAVALGGVVTELIEKAGHAYEAFKKLQEAPQRIAESFHNIAQPIAVANDELRVSNDRLENEIAKLEGRHQNGLKLELDEARLASDKLSESLRRNIADVSKLLQEENVSALSGLLTDRASTSDIRNKIVGERGYGGYKLQLEEITAKYDDQLAAINPNSKGAASQARAIEDQKYAEVQRTLGQALKYVNDELKKRQDLQTQRQGYMTAANGNVLTGIIGHFATSGKQDESIETLRGLQTVFREMQANYSLTRTNTGLEGVVGALKADKANAALDNPLKNKLAELRAELAETQHVAESAGKSIFDEALAKGAGEAAKAISEVNTQLREHNQKPLGLGAQSDITALETQIALTRAVGNAQEEQAKKLKADSDELQRSLDAEAQKTAEKIITIREETAATEELTKARQKGALAIHEAQEAERLAKVGDSEERIAQQAFDEAQYADSIAATVLQIKKQTASTIALTQAWRLGVAARREAEMNAIRNSGEDPSVVAAQLAQKQAQYKLEDTQSGSVRAGGGIKDGFKDYFKQVQDNAKSTAAEVQIVLGTAFDNLNDDLARMVTGQKVSWKSFFDSLASQLIKLSLLKGEGMLGNLFGAGGGSGSAGGGFLSSSFGGFRAEGGAVDPDKSYIVGENGPELFSPSIAGGTIIPNHALAGGGDVYYSIDTRGTDPAQSEARTRRAIMAAHGSAISKSFRAVREHQLRTPQH